MRVVVGTGFAAAAVRNGLGALHHQSSAGRAEGAGRFRLDGVLAFRIVGAGVEETETALLLGHLALFAYRAFDPC